MRGMIVFAVICIIISALCDRRKTLRGFRTGLRMFAAILPSILNVLLLVSLFLSIISQETLASWLGTGTGWHGFVLSSLLGSVALIPAFIAYPLCATLYKNGVSLSNIAVFITTLMMVGIITLPVERKFFGMKIALVRNALSFTGALLIGAAMALFL